MKTLYTKQSKLLVDFKNKRFHATPEQIVRPEDVLVAINRLILNTNQQFALLFI